MKPRAVMEVRPDKFARVCAWCPDKADADAWCDARNYDVSYGMCDTCKNKMLIPAVNEKSNGGYYDEEIKRLEEAEKVDAFAKAREGGRDGRQRDEQSQGNGCQA